MKNVNRYLWMLSLGVGLVACNSEVFDGEELASQESTIKEITVTLPEFKGDADTRTAFEISGEGVNVTWVDKDTIGIFPNQGNQVEFPITGETDSSTATFSGGGWGLKHSNVYAAYFPFSKRNYFRTNENILMSYEGQTQQGNNSAAHLGAYDYLASGAVRPNASNYLDLTLQRLGALVALELTVPESGTYTQLTLMSEDGFVTEAELDISGSSPVVKEPKTSTAISLDLEEVTLTDDDLTLTAYLMLYPVELTSWQVLLRGENKMYMATLEPKTLEAGKPYKLVVAELEACNMLINANLIAAAEQSTGQTFEKNADGTVSLDIEANQAIVDAVTELNLSNLADPHVTDEIGLFKALKVLDCSGNGIESLDVSGNAALAKLECYDNPLGKLDVSHNLNLKYLDCDRTGLTEIDVTNNTALTVLWCGGNELSSLDLSQNVALDSLFVYRTPLTTLDVSNNTALNLLYCHDNQINSLDVSNNQRLRYLSCCNNQLSNLDVTVNTSLTFLHCAMNQLESLDVSNNDKLNSLYCYINQISSLDLSKMSNLIILSCGVNKLSSLNLSTNVRLRELHCDQNQLSSLDLSNNTALTFMRCDGNLLTTLDVSNNTLLTGMYCPYNLLSSLDITKNANLTLENLRCGNQYSNSDKTTSSTLTLMVNESQSKGTIDSYDNNGVYIVVGESVNPPSVDVISFADDLVKSICVANWDTDGDGELSYEEAAAVTMLGDAFAGTEIKTFNEFQYFTGIQILGYGEDYLLSYNYQGTSGSPEPISHMNAAFEECPLLQEITLPESLTAIGSMAFELCESLTEIELPESVTEIGEEAFAGSGLTTITIPENVVFIYNSAFEGCQSLIDVWMTPLTPPTINLEDTNEIENHLFYGCENVTIYVPSESVDAYKTADRWSDYEGWIETN